MKFAPTVFLTFLLHPFARSELIDNEQEETFLPNKKYDPDLGAPNKKKYEHIPNTYCRYYEQRGGGDCDNGFSFQYAWNRCMEDGEDKCMGVMWNSCTGPTSNITVPGAYKLMEAGQEVGDANNPTATCGGKNQARGHWDVFLRVED